MASKKWTGIDFKLFGFTLGLWLITILAILYGMIQIQRSSRALLLTGEHSAQISQMVGGLHFWSGKMLNELSSREEELEHDKTGIAKSKNNSLSDILNAKSKEVDRLLAVLGIIEKDPEHRAQWDNVARVKHALSDLLGVQAEIEKLFSPYFHVTGEAAEIDDLDTSFLDDLMLKESEKLKVLFDEVDRLNKKGPELASEIFEEMHFKVGLALLVAIILGLGLVFQMRKMQDRMLESEKLALLGATTITLHHEINNPLAVIMGSAYLLLNKQLADEEKEKHIKQIRDMAEQISAVVKKIGTVSEIRTKEYLKGENMLDISQGNRPVG